ncbi:MAG TPA: flagellar motor protein MotB [Patescibacteria group bacterium]|nr:flagellar motor protein MotB [Patescibacteria group bacterium]
MSRKKHGPPHEEHADETWLVPYSDLLTLLLALFIVMFAVSQVEQKKFDLMSRSFVQAFSGNTSIFEQMRTSQQPSDAPSNPPKLENVPSVMNMMVGDSEKAYMQETVQLIQTKKSLDKYIADNGMSGDLQTTLTEEGLVIRIRDTAVFPSGSANLLPGARRFGGELAKMLSTLPQKVAISGHTDTDPINTAEFPSNWELSSRRAVNFMRFLLSQDNRLQPTRFSAIGYGEYQPLASNDSFEGRTQNRRVEILIQRNARP